MFPFGLIIIAYFFVQCLYTVDVIYFLKTVLETVLCTDFVVYLSIESKAIMVHRPVGDILFTVVDCFGGEVFSCCIDVSEVIYTVVCEGFI